jgi:hypothetical protein
MEEQQKKIFFIGLSVLVLGVVGLAMINTKQEPVGPGKYDEFASCLKDKGATFYGAWWCPHCNEQKKLFGSSKTLLPYVECYVYPDTNHPLPVCTEKNITGYPTWTFADGSTLNGEIPLTQLADKTSCVLPQ